MADFRRSHVERRNATSDRRTNRYHTRRDWLLSEGVIGVVSCATAITGISGGIVSDALGQSVSNMPWFLFFFGSGAGLILVAVIEALCRRRRDCEDVALRRFAHVRLLLHFVNGLAWLSAFLWLTLTHTFVASIVYESVPLMLFNAFGAIEHAKALWLKPRQAGTTSMACALYRRLHRG